MSQVMWHLVIIQLLTVKRRSTTCSITKRDLGKRKDCHLQSADTMSHVQTPPKTRGSTLQREEEVKGRAGYNRGAVW